MLIALAPSGKHFAPLRSSIPELKYGTFNLGTSQGQKIVPVWEAPFRKRKKPEPWSRPFLDADL
jgi:hypothetical protein